MLANISVLPPVPNVGDPLAARLSSLVHIAGTFEAKCPKTNGFRAFTT
jgi:hypothetical protein